MISILTIRFQRRHGSVRLILVNEISFPQKSLRAVKHRVFWKLNVSCSTIVLVLMWNQRLFLLWTDIPATVFGGAQQDDRHTESHGHMHDVFQPCKQGQLCLVSCLALISLRKRSFFVDVSVRNRKLIKPQIAKVSKEREVVTEIFPGKNEKSGNKFFFSDKSQQHAWTMILLFVWFDLPLGVFWLFCALQISRKNRINLLVHAGSCKLASC